jgi:hypothetical protein
MTKTNLASHLQSATANTNDIHGIKPPVEIPNEWLWLWITLAAVFLIVLTVMAWLLLRRRQALVSLPPPVPPHVRAKQRLTEALAFLSDPNRFCTMVADTTRVYLEERFSLRAPERTTEEFLVELRTSPHLTLDQKQSLGPFLESCDLVKFARFEPTETTLRQLHDAALRLVDETQFDPINAATPPPLPSTSAARPVHEVVNRES